MAQQEVGSQQWIDRIEELVHRAEAIGDPNVRGIAVDLLQAVLTFHAAALERMMEISAAAGPSGEAILKRAAEDDLVSSMLLLHGLHPDDLETRVNRAVEKLREAFGSAGAGLSLVVIEDDSVRLRFETERAWSGAPMKASIEGAIYQAAPEIAHVIIEGFEDRPEPNFVPLSNLVSGARI